MTPEQWKNVANCARQRWYQIRTPAVQRQIIREKGMQHYWLLRTGEFDSWMAALELSGRCPL